MGSAYQTFYQGDIQLNFPKQVSIPLLSPALIHLFVQQIVLKRFFQTGLWGYKENIYLFPIGGFWDS